MTFKAKAIPTLYNGVQFRSRLEARWAAMFDLLGWRWDYETIDCDGYIPDFLVSTGEDRYIIEVKPISPRDNVDQVFSKAFKSGCESPIVVVGHELAFYDNFTTGGDVTIGTIGWPSGIARPFDLWLGDDGRLSAVLGDKDSGGSVNAIAVHDIVALWRRAGNAVQWKSPNRSHHVDRRHGRVLSTRDSELVPKEEVRAFFRSFLEEMGD